MEGKSEAAAAIWDWRNRHTGNETGSLNRRRRLHGALRGAVGLAIGALIFFFWSRIIAYVAFALSGFVLAAALLSPSGLYTGVEKAMARFGHWVGAALTVLLLTPIFFLFFTPYRILFRRGKRGKVKNWLDSGADSYWETRETAPDADSYLKQF